MRHLLICLMVFGLVSCTQPYEQDEIRFALARAPINLDPRFATDAASERLNRLIYQRLVEHDEASRPVPGIAEWEKVSDTHYRFTLRSNRNAFHHGKALTAKDIVATYHSVIDSKTGSPHKGLLDGVMSVASSQPGVIDFKLKAGDNLFPGRLTMGILPADLLKNGHDFHKQPVGSGPFRLVGDGDITSLLFERTPDGQRIRFVEVRDPTVRLLKLARGEVDLLQNDISPELFAWLQEQDNVYTQRQPGNNFTYLGINLGIDKLRDSRVRQAIAHAINRDELLSYIFQGRARYAESVLSPEHWAANERLTSYEYNPVRARQLLKEAGWSHSNPLELVYKTSTDPLRIRIASVISAQLANVGIQVSLQSLDWGTFYGDIKSGNFELYSLSWVGIRSPDIFEYIFHSKSVPPVGANRGQYTNSRVDELIETALYRAKSIDMQDIFLNIQKIIHQDLPYIPLWYEDQFYAARKRIAGYVLSADGNYDGLKYIYRTDMSSGHEKN